MLPEGRWKTASGQLIWLHEMADSHLRNARKFAYDREKLREIDAELKRRKKPKPEPDPRFDISNFH